jgi:hypothetical protein
MSGIQMMVMNNVASADLDIVRTNLQLYLDAADPASYPGTGTTWTDLSPNTYSTTLIGAPAWNSTYFTFDGTTEYVDTNQSLSAEEFSVGAWFRSSAAGIKMILSKETTAGWPWNYRIWLNGGQIVGDISQSGVSNRNINSPLTNYNNGAWYLVMYTRSTATQTLYVNGTQVATAAGSFPSGTISNAQELWIGRSAFTQSGASPSGSYQYTGDIAQVFVYDRVLDSTEILQNYNATKATYGL